MISHTFAIRADSQVSKQCVPFFRSLQKGFWHTFARARAYAFHEWERGGDGGGGGGGGAGR